MIQMDILNEFYIAVTYLVPVYMYGDYNDVATHHAIENKLHKQQCILSLAKYNAFLKIYIYCTIRMFTSPHEYGPCIHHISSSVAPGLWLIMVGKSPHIL